MLPLILISLFLMSINSKIFPKIGGLKILIILSPFILFHSFYSYYSHWSWHAGIQKVEAATAFNIFDTEKFLMQKYYKKNKVEYLVKYLENLDKNSRALFYEPPPQVLRIENKPFPIIEMSGNE